MIRARRHDRGGEPHEDASARAQCDLGAADRPGRYQPLTAVRLAATVGPLLFCLSVTMPALASCTCESCPYDVRPSATGASRLAFGLEYELIDQDLVLVGHRRATVGALPSPEDEIETLNRSVRFAASVPLGRRLSFDALLPYVWREHRHVGNVDLAHGKAASSERVRHAPGLTEWRYSGLGDLVLLGTWIARESGRRAPRLDLQVGTVMPTGHRHVDPVDGEEPEPAARPGGGAWGALVGLRVWRALGDGVERAGRRTLDASVLARFNGRGTDDYRAGDDVQMSVGAALPISAHLDAALRVGARFRAKDGPGRTHALRDNTGGTSIHLSPALRQRIGPHASAFALVQIPLYQRVNRIGLVAPYNVLAGLTLTPGR
jgi:hypothetical protein